jgi:hypothetical protein
LNIKKLKGEGIMPKSYVDEIVSRYLMKEGYLISQGNLVPLAKRKNREKGFWVE